MKLLFLNLSAVKLTAETPEHAPLGGSESALCYLARALAATGHDISIAAHLSVGQSGVIKGIRHFPIVTIKDAAFFAAGKFDAIILCNAPAAAAPLRIVAPVSKIILWAHALPDQPSMQALAQTECKDAIDSAVFVSEWQRGEVAGAFGALKNEQVIGNGIAPAFENMFASPAELLAAKQNRAAYTATPYRGLSVLIRAMQGFGGGTQLDLYSSMQTYQAADSEYETLFAEAARNPDIARHNALPHPDLAAKLKNCAFLFYPSIYPETFCISAAEAMAAGMKIVTTQLGALEDTTQGFADLMPIASPDGDLLAQDFRAAMDRAVAEFTQNPEIWAVRMFEQSRRANELYSWSRRAGQWDRMLAAACRG